MREFVAKVLARAEDRAQHLSHLVAPESLDRELGHHPRSLQLGDETDEPRAGLFTAIREGDDDRLRRAAPGEMEDQIERRIVAPVHVLEREEDRLRARQREDGLRQSVEQPPLVGLGIGGVRRTHVGKNRSKLRENGDELGGSRRQDVTDDRRRR